MTARRDRDEVAEAVAHRNILECLAAADEPLGAIDVARRTHLSTLVVVPVLSRLLDESVVTRTPEPGIQHNRDRRWCYALTPRGSRAAAQAMRASG